MQDYLTPVRKSQHNGESARNLLKKRPINERPDEEIKYNEDCI
jgi:hypothetical protein